ncbi:MAG: Heparinase II/III-like protein [Paenibacillus sp.]|jgi:hypothetical protein|nr:Heparinase II/III-like protein [Paenibacillus sp.]
MKALCDARRQIGRIRTESDRWSVVPITAERGNGELAERTDDWWEQGALLDRFATAYHHIRDINDTSVRMRLAGDCLFLRVLWATGEKALPVLVEILIGPKESAERFYTVSVALADKPRVQYVGTWGEEAERVSTESFRIDNITVGTGQGFIVELPLSSIGVEQIVADDEWRFNVLCAYELNTRPIRSWVPLGPCSFLDNGSGIISFRAPIGAESRFGTVVFGESGRTGPSGEDHSLRAELYDEGYLEKELVFAPGSALADTAGAGIHPLVLEWREPGGRSSTVFRGIPATDRGDSGMRLRFAHPGPGRNGRYQLKIQRDDTKETLSIVSFDRKDMIEAGERLYEMIRPTAANERQDGPAAVNRSVASEEVRRVLATIPEKTGFLYCGLPDKPDLGTDWFMYTWDQTHPERLTTSFSERSYPCDERFPENRSISVPNRKGDPVDYPYYEDAQGRKFFMSGALWYKQRAYAAQQTEEIAKRDALGAARLLVRFAEVYRNYVPVNDIFWRNYPYRFEAGPPYPLMGGLWYRWSVGELTTLIHLLRAYLFVKRTDAFQVLKEVTGQDAERNILDGMFRRSGDFARTYPIVNSNFEYNNWIGFILLGKALNEPDYIHDAVERIEKYVSETFLSDGFFKEVTFSYHTQSTQGLEWAIEELAGWSDPPGYVSPRTGKRFDDLDLASAYPILRQAMRIPRTAVYPDGKFLPIHDTWAARESGHSDKVKGSFLLPAAGIARLEAEVRPASSNAMQPVRPEVQAYLAFSPKYGHHQLDPLNLALYAEGQELLPDIGYTHTNYRRWSACTFAHNTVLVDGRDMAAGGKQWETAKHGGCLESFVCEGEAVQLVRARYEEAYEVTETYGREVWLIRFPDEAGTYVLDLFRLAGGNRHEYTLHGDANRDARFVTAIPLTSPEPYMLPPGTEVREPRTENDAGHASGHYYGYMYVRDVGSAELEDGDYSVCLETREDGKRRAGLHVLGSAGPDVAARLFLGKAPSLKGTRLEGLRKDTPEEFAKYWLPKLVVRREGPQLRSRFITALEPVKADTRPRLQRIERLAFESDDPDDIAVAIHYGETTDIVLSRKCTRATPLIVGDIELHGRQGFIRLREGRVTELLLIGGTRLSKHTIAVTDVGPSEGIISKVLRKAAGDDINGFETIADVSARLSDRYIVIAHPDGRTRGFRIGHIENRPGRSRIDTGDMDPGFTIDGEGHSAMDYYPFIGWEGTHTFRIDNVCFSRIQAAEEDERERS